MMLAAAVSREAWILKGQGNTLCADHICGTEAQVGEDETRDQEAAPVTWAHNHWVLETEEGSLLCGKLGLKHCGGVQDGARTWEFSRLALNCLHPIPHVYTCKQKSRLT